MSVASYQECISQFEKIADQVDGVIAKQNGQITKVIDMVAVLNEVVIKQKEQINSLIHKVNKLKDDKPRRADERKAMCAEIHRTTAKVKMIETSLKVKPATKTAKKARSAMKAKKATKV